MATVRVTRGRLTALWLVLRTLRSMGGEGDASEVMLALRRSGLRGGGLPVRDGVRLAREGRFIADRTGSYALDHLGHRALELCQEEEPSTDVVRLFVTVLLLGHPPAWVAWWQGAPDALEDVIPVGERRVMRDAGLLPPPSADDLAAWTWWQALARVPPSQQTTAARKLIGDAGEALTVEYEQRRLTAQGRGDLAASVAWVAQESDAYGFDVLSFAGVEVHGLAPEDRIAIEVKSTALPVVSDFPLFLTAHEWDIARGLGNRSVLHLWAAVDPGPPPWSAAEAPLVLQTNDLAEHLPRPPPCGAACTWESARVALPIASSG